MLRLTSTSDVLGWLICKRLVVIRIEIRLSARFLGMDVFIVGRAAVVAIESLGTSKGVL